MAVKIFPPMSALIFAADRSAAFLWSSSAGRQRSGTGSTMGGQRDCGSSRRPPGARRKRSFPGRNQPGRSRHGLRCHHRWGRALFAGIPHPGAHHSVEKPEPGIRSPESAEGKDGRPEFRRDLPVQGRNLPGTGPSREKYHRSGNDSFKHFHSLHLPKISLSLFYTTVMFLYGTDCVREISPAVQWTLSMHQKEARHPT